MKTKIENTTELIIEVVSGIEDTIMRQVQDMDTEAKEVTVHHKVLGKVLFIKVDTKAFKIIDVMFLGGAELGNFHLKI